MDVSNKINKVKDLLAQGHYADITCRVLSHVLPRSLNFYAKYYYLRREFKSFVENYECAKMLTGGIEISSGGCGFKEKITPQTSAKPASTHSDAGIPRKL